MPKHNLYTSSSWLFIISTGQWVPALWKLSLHIFYWPDSALPPTPSQDRAASFTSLKAPLNFQPSDRSLNLGEVKGENQERTGDFDM